jgi:hypothetical protein
MTEVHTAYRRLMLASACALGVAACGSGRVVPSLTSVTPPLVCGGSAATLLVAGQGFEARVAGVLDRPAGETPTVTATASGGSPVVLPSRWLSTTSLAVDLAPQLLGIGSYDLTVANPDGASTTLPHALSRVASPRVDNVTPGMLCGTGGDFTVAGADFVAGATVTLGDGTMTLPGASVVVTSATQLTVHFAANTFANNAQLDMTVTNPDGCAFTLANALKRKTGGGGCP